MEVEIKEKKIELKEPFKYNLATLDFLPYAEITVVDNKIFGKGEIACSLDVNGETVQSSIGLVVLLQKILNTKSVDNLKDISIIMANVENYIAHNTAIKCGLEQALFEILSKKSNKTVIELLGVKKNRKRKIQTTISFLGSLNEYERKITELAKLKPEYIKFKIGNNFELERKAILMARKSIQGALINVDGNQVFENVNDAADFLNQLPEGTLSWAEQILSKDATEEFIDLKNKTKVSQMADESIHTAKDALLYAKNDYVDYINIKLAKSGGILEAKKIISIAKKYNKSYILGSMVHGERGLGYNLAFGVTESFLTYDFYSYFTLKEKSEVLISRDLYIK